MVGRVVASIALLASIRCASPSAERAHTAAPAFAHLDECRNPIYENMAWRPVQGSVLEVTGARTFRLRTDSGQILRVSLANIAEPADSGAMAMLQRLIDRKRVSVMVNPSADLQKDITGEVQDEKGRDIAHELLRAGAAAFVPAPAYTLSDYSECVNRIAEREAKAEGLGVWHHQ